MIWTLLPASQIAAIFDVLLFSKTKKNQQQQLTTPKKNKKNSPTTPNASSSSIKKIRKEKVFTPGYSRAKKLLKKCLHYGIVSGIGVNGILAFSTTVDFFFPNKDVAKVLLDWPWSLLSNSNVETTLANSSSDPLLESNSIPTATTTTTNVTNQSIDFSNNDAKLIFGYSNLSIGILGLFAAFDKNIHFWFASILAYSSFRFASFFNYIFTNSNKINWIQKVKNLFISSDTINNSTPTASSVVNEASTGFISTLKNNYPYISIAAPVYLLSLLTIYCYFFPSSKNSLKFNSKDDLDETEYTNISNNNSFENNFSPLNNNNAANSFNTISYSPLNNTNSPPISPANSSQKKKKKHHHRHNSSSRRD